MRALHFGGVTHRYRAGRRAFDALSEVTFDVDLAELVVLEGPSGSGKSAVCHLAFGVVEPQVGEVTVFGTAAARVNDWAVRAIVPQQHGLIRGLSVADNLAAFEVSQQKADAALAALGLAGLHQHRVEAISLGEQQRVAVARAVAHDAEGGQRLIVLDEPTGHQDEKHAGLVMAELGRCREQGAAVLIASHDPLVLNQADRVISLRGGKVTLQDR